MLLDAVMFCARPGSLARVDDDFAPEFDEAQRRGLVTLLLDHDAATTGQINQALRKIGDGAGGRLLYRGWMMPVDAYDALHKGMIDRNWNMVTSANDYQACHHIDRWVALLGKHTPRTRWISHKPPYAEQELVDLLGKCTGPVLVKDFVKSEKHAWLDACFIPDPKDTAAATRVIRRFLELRGDLFEGGLVLRDYIPLRSIGADPRSGMPLSQEIRTFWTGSRCAAHADYWTDSTVGAIPARAHEAAARIDRPFFTIDMGMTEAGDWIVIEVGDGQVSSRPDSLSSEVFFGGLLNT